MTDKMYVALIEQALRKTGEAAELAFALHGLLGGNDPDDAAQLLEKYGYTDQNGEWNFNE